MNRYHLVHVTEFVYDGPVSESYNEVRLRPMHDDTQSCLSFRLTTAPASPAFSYRDALGNWVHQVNVLPVHNRLRVQAESVVLAHDSSPPHSWMLLSELEEQHEELIEEFYDMLAASKYVPHLAELAPLIAEAEQRCDGTVAGFAQVRVGLDSRALPVREGSDSREFVDRGFLAAGRRRLPGLRAPAAGSAAQARNSGALCVGIPGAAERGQSRGQAGRGDWRPGFPRLGRSVHSRYRMDAAGSHAGQAGRHASCAHRLWTRLRRCGSGARRVQRARRTAVVGGRERATGTR